MLRALNSLAYRAGWLGIAGLLVGAAWARGGWVEDRVDPATGERQTVIHVKLFDLPDPTRTDTPARADAAVVKEFVRRFPSLFAERHSARAKAHPERYGSHNWDNVRVELHRFTGLQVEGVESALLAIAGRVAPDVMYVNFRQSHTYISEGFLYPLDRPEDGYLASMSEEELAFRVHPKIWPVIRRKGPQGETHVWALPYGGALGKVVLYRKDLFEERGVPFPHNDWTWDDFLEACRRLTDPARGIYGLHMSRGKHESWWWMTFLWSAGGDCLVYDEAADEWHAVFDSQEAAVALDFYLRLCTEPWVDAQGVRRYGYCNRDPDWGTVSAKWERGEIGMMFAYIDEKVFQKVNPDVTGMAPVPIGPTGQRGGEINSMMMGLFAGIEHPAVRDAAWEYMRFYDSEDAMRIRTQILVEGGLGRFINPRYLEKFGYHDLIRLSPPRWKECFEIALATGRPEPYGKNSNIAYDIMTQPIQEAEQLALAGRLPADRERRLEVLRALLHRAVQRANEEMLGRVAPEERRRRRAGAWALLAAIAGLFGWGLARVGRAFAGSPAAAGRRGTLKKYAGAYLLLLPAVLTILVWQYVPLFRGTLMAFQDFRIMGGSSWVGVDNFGDMLWNRDWWAALWNSLRYSVWVIALTFLPPVILALMLAEVPRGKVLFRTLYYLPAVMTGLVVVLLWKSFCEPSEWGVLNAILLRVPAWAFLALGGGLFALCGALARRLAIHECRGWATFSVFLGVLLASAAWAAARPMLTQPGLPVLRRLLLARPEPLRWLGDPATAMLACVLPMAWAGVGPGSLIYLAALKGVSDELYESADLDGATLLDKVLFIVFPTLRPLLVIHFVGVFIGAWLHAGANVLAMTGGAARTEVADLHIFYKAYIFLKFGPATAMAWFLGFLLVGFTVHQLQMLSKLEFRAAQQP